MLSSLRRRRRVVESLALLLVSFCFCFCHELETNSYFFFSVMFISLRIRTPFSQEPSSTTGSIEESVAQVTPLQTNLSLVNEVDGNVEDAMDLDPSEEDTLTVSTAPHISPVDQLVPPTYVFHAALLSSPRFVLSETRFLFCVGLGSSSSTCFLLSSFDAKVRDLIAINGRIYDAQNIIVDVRPPSVISLSPFRF